MKFGDFKVTSPATLKALLAGDIHNAIIAETSGGIEGQEAAGQKKFVASQNLPIDCPHQALESLGFIFGGSTNDLFVRVQFPEGWTKKATEHSMYSDLLDAKGRQCGSIFYKAAFYDRRASMQLLQRYRPGYTYDEPRADQRRQRSNLDIRTSRSKWQE